MLREQPEPSLTARHLSDPDPRRREVGLATNSIAAVGERTVRRVVTGTADGVSRVSRDDLVRPVTVSALPGYAWHRLWSLDDSPTDPPSVEVEGPLAHFPPPGGIRFNLYTVPPQQSHASGPLSPPRQSANSKSCFPGEPRTWNRT